MPNKIRQGGNPLNFVSSDPANGATGVPPSIGVITLEFDKNVVNDAVWDINKNSVHLFEGSTPFPAAITRIPDTVDFEMRRFIFVNPLEQLKPLTNYRVVIDPTLTAKSGETLGETVTVHFKTGRGLK
ncbi:MAG: Ig-like domain-containing protein [Chitinophagales bacterium]